MLASMLCSSHQPGYLVIWSITLATVQYSSSSMVGQQVLEETKDDVIFLNLGP